MDQEANKAERLNHAAVLNVGKPGKDNQFLRRPVKDRNPSFGMCSTTYPVDSSFVAGLQKFMPLQLLESRKYIDNDTLYLKVELTDTAASGTYVTYE